MAICLASGCATQTKPAKTTYYFYPPPPNEARIQFLTAFSSEKGLRGGEERTFLNYLTGTVAPDKPITKPYGAAANRNKIYVCDTELGAVLVADLPTRRMHMLAAQGEGVLKLPLNIAIDSDGTCYIADSGREQVVIFDKDENYVAAMGKAGEMKPRDVALSKDRIYVADLQGHCVHAYDKATRNLLLDIPPTADRTNVVRGLFTPTNLALDSQGRIYVSDTGAFRVQLYDPDGKHVRSVGEMGDSLGQFARVKGVAVDRDNRLYAVDAMSQVVQIFDNQGGLLTWFAQPETGEQMKDLPAKVFVDYDDVGFFERYAAPNFKIEHLVVVINQLGSRKVSVFGFGQKK